MPYDHQRILWGPQYPQWTIWMGTSSRGPPCLSNSTTWWNGWSPLSTGNFRSLKLCVNLWSRGSFEPGTTYRPNHDHYAQQTQPSEFATTLHNPARIANQGGLCTGLSLDFSPSLDIFPDWVLDSVIYDPSLRKLDIRFNNEDMTSSSIHRLAETPWPRLQELELKKVMETADKLTLYHTIASNISAPLSYLSWWFGMGIKAKVIILGSQQL